MSINRSRRVLPLVPFSSLTDLAFILLVFFILSANFATPLPSELKLPQTKSALIKPKPDQLILSLNQTGELSWDARESSLDLAQATPEDQADFLSRLKARLGNEELGLAIEAECPYPLLRQTLALLEEEGIEDLFFVLGTQP